MDYQQYQQIPAATVADLLEFNSWPEDQKEVARRVMKAELIDLVDKLEERLEELENDA